MNTITIKDDIPVCFVTAESFPDGILASHQKLHALVPFSAHRRYFGLSRPEGDRGIVYRAAVEELHEKEGKDFDCDRMVIRKGVYISHRIANYKEQEEKIGMAFDELLKNPAIDPNGYCVEWYVNDTDVDCMVRLKE